MQYSAVRKCCAYRPVRVAMGEVGPEVGLVAASLPLSSLRTIGYGAQPLSRRRHVPGLVARGSHGEHRLPQVAVPHVVMGFEVRGQAAHCKLNLAQLASDRSNNKVERAMNKLSGTFYNAMPGRILQAGMYRTTRSSSRLGRNRNVQEFANSVTDFQGMSEEISQIGQKYKEPKNFQEAWNHPDPSQKSYGGRPSPRNTRI